MQKSVNDPPIIMSTTVISSFTKPAVIHILHVDDDASLLEISKTILMDMENFEIDHALCVDEALKKLEMGSYDVVVSDYEMPQKNGLQFLKELKEKNHKVPFILFTGKGREEITIQALNLGANGYFNKQGSPETVYGELAHGIRQIVENSRAKNALRESESKFKAYIENSPVAIFVANAEANYEYVNDAASKLLGYSKEELLEMSIPQILYQFEANSRLASFEKTKETGYAYVEATLRSKNGDPIYVKINSIKLPDGKLLAYCENVSEQKKTEEELKQKYDVLERVGESVSAGLAIISKDYHVIWANKTLMALGVTSNKKCFQTFNNLDRVCPDCGVKKVFEENKPIDIHEFKSVDQQGKVTWVELRVTPLKDKNGNVTAGLELVVPINERKQNEITLQRSEERFRTIFEKAFEGILAADIETKRFVFANPAICKLTGYSSQELLTMGIDDIHPKEDLDRIIKDFNEISEGKKSFSEDIPVLRKDGKVVYCDITGRTSTFENRAISVGFFRDNTERKKIEDQLKKNEKHLTEIISNAPIGIATSDSNMHFLTANMRFRNILGYSEDELRKLTFKDITVAGDVQESILYMKKLCSGDIEFFSQEMQFIRKDNVIINGKVTVSAIGDKEGKPTLFIAQLEDITERKKIELKLVESEEKSRTLSDESPNMIFINLKGKVVYVNKKCIEVLGYSSKEFTSPDFNFLSIVAPECHPVLREAYAKHMKGEEVPPYEYTLISRKGDRIEVEISTKLISYGGETAILGVVTDITERKKADDAVKASEAKLREVLDASPFPVALVDINDDKIFYWSQSATALFGHTAPTAKQWYEIAYPDLEYRGQIIEKWKPMLELAKQTGKWLNTGEYNITCKDGSVKVCNLYATFLADVLIVTFDDITERKKTQQMLVRSERKLREYSMHLKDMVDLRTIQLKDANERLVKSERFAAIGELAGMVGHDLRNPLAGIKNATYFLKKKGSTLSEEQTRVMLENIEKGIDHSDKIINDLLEYAGEIHLKPYAVSAFSLLENVLGFIKVPATVKIINEIPNNLTIKVDQNKVERVFINLIKNAIDAMPNGGLVTIRCKQIKDKAEISFADTGTGIPAEVLPKLFNPLFTTKAQGMGFGLAICKRVVEAHGGTITVETACGNGTTFKVTVPIEKKTDNDTEKIRLYSTGSQTQERACL